MQPVSMSDLTDKPGDDITAFTFGSGSPSAAFTAGIHGDEQTAIYAAHELINYLGKHEDELTGTVTILPLCNVSAFRNRTRNSPFDGRNLNRIFDKREQGGFSYELANRIWELTKDADYVIDLHCCGDHGSIYSFAMVGESEGQLEMLLDLGIPTAVTSTGIHGPLFTEVTYSGRQGALVEVPGGQPNGIIDLEAARVLIAHLLRFLNRKGIIPDSMTRDGVLAEEVRVHSSLHIVTTPRDGLFILEAQPGARLRQGEVIGTLDGEAWTMPFDGTLLSVMPTRYLFAGEFMFNVVAYSPFEKTDDRVTI